MPSCKIWVIRSSILTSGYPSDEHKRLETLLGNVHYVLCARLEMTTAPAKPLHRSAIEGQIVQAQKDFVGLLGENNELLQRIRREEKSLRAACRIAKTRAEQCDAAFEFEVAQLKDTIERQRRKLRIGEAAQQQQQHQQHQHKRGPFTKSFARALREAAARFGGAVALKQQTPSHGSQAQAQAQTDKQHQGQRKNGKETPRLSNHPHLKLIDGVVHMSLVRRDFHGRKDAKRKKKVKVKMAFGRPVPDGFHIKKTHDVPTHHRSLGHNRQATFLDTLRSTGKEPRRTGAKKRGTKRAKKQAMGGAGTSGLQRGGGHQDHMWIKPERPVKRPFLSPKSQTSLLGAAAGGAEPYLTMQETRNAKYGVHRERLSSAQIVHRQMMASARAHSNDLQSSLRSTGSALSSSRKTQHMKSASSSSVSRRRGRHRRELSAASSVGRGGGKRRSGEGVDDGSGRDDGNGVDKAHHLRSQSKLMMRKLRR